MRYVNVELKDTALVIECPTCETAYVVVPKEGVILKPGLEQQCFNKCGTALIPEEFNEQGGRKLTIVDWYAELLKESKARSDAKTATIRLRVPIDE